MTIRSHDEELRNPAVAGIETRGDTILIRLAGELDLYNAGELRAAIAGATEQSPARLVLDLSEVAFVDSTAFGAMIDAKRKMEDGAFVLCAPSRDVRRALEVSGLDRHFTVVESVDAP